MKPEPLLPQRSDALDAAALTAAVEGPLRDRVRRVELFAELPSTNQYLLDADRPALGLADVCLAEAQTAGRGRFARRWHAPLGAGVCLSVAWQFAVAPRELALLTLALGVVVRRVVADLTGAAIALKWPNDLVHEDRKLGGILVEVGSSAPSGCRVVAGLGLNVALPNEALAAVADSGTRATDLCTLTRGAPPPRTELALALIESFAAVFAGYADSGFAPYRVEWQHADGLLGRSIRVHAPSGPWLGTAAGIDADGALLVVATDGRRQRVLSDDVSVRVER